MNIVIFEAVDTAFIDFEPSAGGTVLLDRGKKEHVASPDQAKKLSYTRQKRRTSKNGFVYSCKAWFAPIGYSNGSLCLQRVRKIKVQCQRIREDGTLGPRINVFEMHNGEPISRR